MSAPSNPASPPPPLSTATPPPLPSSSPPSPTTPVPASPTPSPPMSQPPPSAPISNPPPPIVPESPPPAPPISPPSPVMPSPPPPPDHPPPPIPNPSPPILPESPAPPISPPSPVKLSPPPSPDPPSPPSSTPSMPVVPPLPPPPSPPVAPPPQPLPSPPVVPPSQPPSSPSVVPPPQPTPIILPPPPPPPPQIQPPSNYSPPPPSPTTPSPPPPAPRIMPPRSPPSKPESPPPPDIQPPSTQPSSPPPLKTPTESPIRLSPPPPNTQPKSPTRLSPPPPSNSSVPVILRPILSPPPPDTPSSSSYPSPTNSSNIAPGTLVTGKGSSGEGIKTETVVGIGVAVAFVLLLVAVLFWFVKRKKNNDCYVMPTSVTSLDSQLSEVAHPSVPLFRTPSSSEEVYSPLEPGPGNSKLRFTYDELSEATNGFSPQNILGEGGFGCVYKGCLSDGKIVAVKQLKVGGGQGEREFQAEVEIISRVHHRHLVSLVGCCIKKNQRLLVYDFVPNSTLHNHLHGHGRPVMDWATRVKVSAGAARGIAYLHEDCHPRIIHRDIKSSNILLDNSFEAQVSDFGLAKFTMDAETHVTTRVMGTFGYMAPEYASSGKLTDRSDVFSFGVVLLELITGRKPVDESQPVGDESLVGWARPLMSRALETGCFEGLPDPRLSGNYNENEMLIMIEAAAACVRHSAPIRPRMGMVMRALDDLTNNMDLQNGVRPGNSELYTGANSEEIRIFNNMAFGGQLCTSDFSNFASSNQQDQ